METFREHQTFQALNSTPNGRTMAHTAGGGALSPRNSLSDYYRRMLCLLPYEVYIFEFPSIRTEGSYYWTRHCCDYVEIQYSLVAVDQHGMYLPSAVRKVDYILDPLRAIASPKSKKRGRFRELA